MTASADSTWYQDAIQTVAPINLPRLPMVFTSEYSQSPVDPLINLLGEADVVRSSVAHLLGPVDIALHSVLPSELSRRLRSNSEYVVGRSRLDVVWRLDNGRNLAALEFKRPYTVFPDEWSAAAVTSREQAEDVLHRSYDTDNETLLKGNAVMCGKQVHKYLLQTECTHIVLFDWRNMIGLARDSPAGGRPGFDSVTAPLRWWAASEHYSAESTSVPLQTVFTFRQALLSVLIDAVMTEDRVQRGESASR